MTRNGISPPPSSWGLSHGCPVEFFWTKRMTLILLCIEHLAVFRDSKRDQRHAAPEYGIPRDFEACAVGRI